MSPKLAATILKLSAFGVFGFALLLATASYSSIDAPARFILDLLDWPLDGNHNAISRDMRWMTAVVAGLLILVSTIIIGIIAPLVGEGNKRVANIALMGIIGWIIVDCIGSIAAGVTSNAIWNFGFGLPFLIALIGMDPKKG